MPSHPGRHFFRSLFFCDFAVDTHPALIRAADVKGPGPALTLVQVGPVLQGNEVRVHPVPQFVAQGRAEILHHKGVARLVAAGAAAAFGNGQFDFYGCSSCWVTQTSARTFSRVPGPISSTAASSSGD